MRTAETALSFQHMTLSKFDLSKAGPDGGQGPLIVLAFRCGDHLLQKGACLVETAEQTKTGHHDFLECSKEVGWRVTLFYCVLAHGEGLLVPSDLLKNSSAQQRGLGILWSKLCVQDRKSLLGLTSGSQGLSHTMTQGTSAAGRAICKKQFL